MSDAIAMQRDGVLIIDRGDLASLAACAIAPAPQRSILWHLVEPDAAARPRQAAVAHHARAWPVQRVITARSVDPGVGGMAPPPRLFESIMLLQAATAAAQLRCGTIVWPRRVGPDGAAVAAVADRADLVMTLIGHDQSDHSIGLELPLLELTEAEVLTLADDAGAPMRAFWPCESDLELPCGDCPACRAHHGLFAEAGLPWPWEGDGRLPGQVSEEAVCAPEA